MTDRPVRVCIVGAGPRGLSVLERICANAGDRAVTVHIVDPHPAGAGKVWRSDQHRHLLANTVASQVTMFTDDTVDMDGPVVAGPSLAEWARFLTVMGSVESYDDWVLEEAKRTGPNTYPSRAFYGVYLRWVFRRVVSQAPAGVQVHFHQTAAVDLVDVGPEGTQRVVLDGGATLDGIDAVVLAQGHLGATPTDVETALGQFAQQHGLHYVPPLNPADADLSFVEAGEPVLLRGLGLCFFDYMALLTTGRGGRFDRRDDRLTYLPSGAEPLIYAGSRRGIPFHARGENQKGASLRHEPVMLTVDVIDKLRTMGTEGNGIDFRRDVWPLVAKEVETVYYATLISQRGCGCDADRFRSAYLPLEWGSEAEAGVLEDFAVPDGQQWDWESVLHPHHGLEFAGPDDFRSWLIGYLAHDIDSARQGNLTNPIKTALDVLRDLRNEVRLVVDHGGLSGRSYRDDLNGWYTPLNAFLSIGPPTSRIEELLALIEAGVLTIVGPDLRVETDPDTGRFTAESALGPESRVSLTTLIEAQLGGPNLGRTTDPLLQRLLTTGQASAYVIADSEAGDFHTTGLAVTQRPYHLVDATGSAHPRRFALGVPTEGVHWVTAAGIRPGVNSVTLADSDAIARAALLASAPEAVQHDLRPVPATDTPVSTGPNR